MADYVQTEEDNGGVHLNSGIPNRAFALAARKVGGRSWQQTGQVWYDAMTSGEVTTQTDFAGFARATVASADRLFPGDSRVATHVRAAWEEVGVLTADETADSVTAAPGPARRVAVRRSGGFANVVRAGELDLDSDPHGPEVRELLTRLDLQSLATSTAGPDRFVYTLEFGPDRVTVLERDLTPELHRVVQLVLGSRGDALGLS